MKTPRMLMTLAVAASAAGAQAPTQPNPPSQTITFDDAIRIALRQNTALRQANNSAALSSATVRQQRLSFLPDLRFTTNTGQNYGRTFSEEEGRIIDQTTQSVNAGVSSSVTLFNGLTNVASLRSAQLSEDAEGPGATILLRIDGGVPADVRAAITDAVGAKLLEVVDLT